MNTLINIEQQFEKNQSDLFLDDLKVLLAGQTVVLYKESPDRPAAIFDAREPVIVKVKRWCVKNCYRCSAIKNNRIQL